MRGHLGVLAGEVPVQPRQRVAAHTTPNDFKVQVRTVTVAGDAAVPDELALSDGLAGFDNAGFEMGVPGLQHPAAVVRVADAHAGAVAHHAGGAPVPVLRPVHRAVLGGIDRRARRRPQVDGAVGAAVLVRPARRDEVQRQRPEQQNIAIF